MLQKRGSYAPALMVRFERKKQRATSATSNAAGKTSTVDHVPQPTVGVNIIIILLKRTRTLVLVILMRLLMIQITNQTKVGVWSSYS